jgi:hypothetical protein
MTVWFAASSGRLRVSGDDPLFEWEGLVDGLTVLDLIVLRPGDSAVVLLDPPAGQRPVMNLVGVASDATVRWRAGFLRPVNPMPSSPSRWARMG